MYDIITVFARIPSGVIESAIGAFLAAVAFAIVLKLGRLGRAVLSALFRRIRKWCGLLVDAVRRRYARWVMRRHIRGHNLYLSRYDRNSASHHSFARHCRIWDRDVAPYGRWWWRRVDDRLIVMALDTLHHDGIISPWPRYDSHLWPPYEIGRYFAYPPDGVNARDFESEQDTERRCVVYFLMNGAHWPGGNCPGRYAFANGYAELNSAQPCARCWENQSQSAER